jgi:hypothetical protein
MDSRDFRKKWLNLQESWTEEANVNVNATKAEKLEEKRKLPDALKAHQFGKKKDAAEETDKKEDKGPEKDKKDDKKADKKDDKKPSFLKKKATEAKKVVKPVKKVKEDGAAAANGCTDEYRCKKHGGKGKVREDSAGGAVTSAAVGGAKGTCPDAHIGAPERLKKRNESKLFSHFKKYMAEAGLPVDMDAPAGIPGEDVAGAAVAELTGEEPVGEPGLDAPVDDAANVLADIQARFPGKKIRICVEADPTEPFSTEDVAAAEAAIAAVPEEVEGLEGDEGAEEMLAPEAGGELPVDQDIADEVRVESCSMREDEEEDMGAADGVEEVPTGDELDAEGGEEALGGVLGAEEHASEASPEALSMTPEQWTEFLAGGAGEEGLGDELAGATDVADAGEGEDSDSESNKSEDTLG